MKKKIDWWWKLNNGKTIGPRQELVAEMYKEAGVDFYMYSSEKFFEYGSLYLKEIVNKKTLKEIKSNAQVLNNSILMDELRQIVSRNILLHGTASPLISQFQGISPETMFGNRINPAFLEQMGFLNTSAFEANRLNPTFLEQFGRISERILNPSLGEGILGQINRLKGEGIPTMNSQLVDQLNKISQATSGVEIPKTIHDKNSKPEESSSDISE